MSDAYDVVTKTFELENLIKEQCDTECKIFREAVGYKLYGFQLPTSEKAIDVKKWAEDYKHPISKGIYDIDTSGKRVERKDMTAEHVVPLKVLRKVLREKYNAGTLDRDWCNRFIDKYLIICLVTKEEDKMLNKKKLQDSMPKDWRLDDSLTADPWARYRIAGINPLEAHKEVSYNGIL